ncbi:GFA family protein [Roseivivax sediminis]|uniref:Uncharacterized conserved protein n=1 Tax=Roseivivax sediminis TaxID=936889 RepID=A0A1I1VFS3_9RHOB|nr:GFA family protein [Roseivivax sediminis]SFD81719.1 Uncharacterized conserved protein [Roseivivax sediminis]
MTDAAPQRGACLCGASTFTARPAPEADVCHCSYCRKWSGGMFIGTPCGDSLSFDDGAPIRTYQSSDWGHRIFCGECGSALAWQSSDGKMTVVSIQAFEHPEDFPLTMEIFIDSKPTNYALANETKTLTGAQVFELFAAQPEADA